MNKLERSKFKSGPKWFYNFLKDTSNYLIFDGFHFFGGSNDALNAFNLYVAGCIAGGAFVHMLLTSGAFWGFVLYTVLVFVVWFTSYYFSFNLHYHIIFMMVPERSVLRCIPIVDLIYMYLNRNNRTVTKLKIYQMNYYDYYADYSLANAIVNYCEWNSDDEHLVIESPREISIEGYGEMIYDEHLEKKVSFMSIIQSMNSHGIVCHYV